MRAWRYASCLAVIAALACAGRETVWVPAPPLGGARTIVYALEVGDRVSLFAAPIDGEALDPTVLELDSLGRAHLWSLLYERPIEDLPFSAGEIAPAAPGAASRALPTPDRMFVAAYLGRNVEAWASADQMSDALTAFKIEGAEETPCRAFEERLFLFDAREGGTIALALDGETALIGTDRGNFYYATLESLTKLSYPKSTPHWAGFRDDEGVAWLSGDDGRLAFGRPELDEPFTLTSTSPIGGRLEWLDGARGGADFELYAVSLEGGAARFDGETWSVLEAPTTVTAWERAVAWVGPGEAVIAGLSNPIARYRDGRLSDETPLEGLAPPVAAAHIPGVGTVVGTKDGAILRHDGDAWRPLPGSPFAVPVSAFTAYEGGFIASGGTGITAQYVPGYGFCPSFSVSSPIIKHIAVLDGGLVLIGGVASTANSNTVVVLKER